METNFTTAGAIYEQFQSIKDNDNYVLIHFFESHESELYWMNNEQRFMMLCYYTNALAAAEQFDKHIYYANQLIEDSIIHDFHYVDGVDVYLYTLYQKAKSHLALKQLDKAIYIGKELLKIAPGNKQYRKLLYQALMMQRPEWVRKNLALSVLGLGIWTVVEICQLLWIELFLSELFFISQIFQYLAIALLVTTLSIALFGQYQHVEKTIQDTLRK